MAGPCSRGTSLFLTTSSVHGFPACSDRPGRVVPDDAPHPGPCPTLVVDTLDPVFFGFRPRILARGRSRVQHAWPGMPTPVRHPHARTHPCVPSPAMTRSPVRACPFTSEQQWGAHLPEDRPQGAELGNWPESPPRRPYSAFERFFRPSLPDKLCSSPSNAPIHKKKGRRSEAYQSSPLG